MREVNPPNPDKLTREKRPKSSPASLATVRSSQLLPSSIPPSEKHPTPLTPADRAASKPRKPKSFQVPTGKRPKSLPTALAVTQSTTSPPPQSNRARAQSTHVLPADRPDRKTRRPLSQKAKPTPQQIQSLASLAPQPKRESTHLPPSDRPESRPKRKPTSLSAQKANRSKRPLLPTYGHKICKRGWKPKHVLSCVGIFVGLSMAIPTVFLLLQRDPVEANSGSSFDIEAEESKEKIYPASIPYFQTEAECLEHDKEWYDGKCWDAEHSHLY